jgi:hypothetical protein
MKANDLRLGNLIYWNIPEKIDTIHTVVGIRNDKPQTTPISLGERIEDYKPIPLTEEWLKKFGFEDLYYGEDKFGWIKEGVNISKYFNFVLMLPNAEYYDSTKIKWVHDLQNLYYAITGVELSVS